MKLIDLYIQEVTRRLPEKVRADIALELRSTIEDSLPSDYNEEDVKTVLEKLGNPVSLANGYQDKPMYLIGPRYFDIYVSLLKMIIPIAAAISLISIIADYFIGFSGEDVIASVFTLIGKAISITFEVGLQVFFWLTIIFAIIERTNTDKDSEPLTNSFKKWTPDELKNITYIPKKKAISKFEVFGSLMWTAIWATLYFNANKLVGVYESINNRLEYGIPAFNQDVLLQYWPFIVIVIGGEIAGALYKLLKGQWTKRMAIGNAIFQIFVSTIFIVILLNPNLLNQEFITYVANLMTITDNQFEMWIVNGGILLFIVGAVLNVYDGFKKAKIREQ